MEVSLTKCKTDKYNVYVIDDDEFVGAQIQPLVIMDFRSKKYYKGMIFWI